MRLTTARILLLFLICAGVARAQCDVVSLDVSRYVRWGEFTEFPVYGHVLRAFDADGALLWEHDFGDAAVADARVLGPGADPEILVIGTRGELYDFGCDGTLRERLDPTVSAFRTTGHFADDGSSFTYFTTSAPRTGVRGHSVPTSQWRDLLVDRTAFETWVRRFDGEDGPYDEYGVYVLEAGADTLTVATAYQTDGPPYDGVYYHLDPAAGEFLDHTWVGSLEIVDEHRVVARDRDNAVLWTRDFDARVVGAMRVGQRSAWAGRIVLDRLDGASPRLVGVDASGAVTSELPVADDSATSFVLAFDEDVHVTTCSNPGSPHSICFTYLRQLVVVDPERDRTVLVPFYEPNRGIRTESPTIPVRTSVYASHDDAYFLGGTQEGVGPVVYWADYSEPYYGAGTIRLRETWPTLPGDVEIVGLVPSWRALEVQLSNGISVWLKGGSAYWRPDPEKCIAYDVDASGRIDAQDVDAIVDHVLGVRFLDAPAVCRADIDGVEDADVSDAVRIVDRVRHGTVAVVPDPEDTPAAIDVTARVVDATWAGSEVEIVVEVGFERALRGFRFGLETTRGSTIVAHAVRSTEDVELVRSNGGEVLAIWNAPRDTMHLTVELRGPTVLAGQERLVVRRMSLAAPDAGVVYTAPIEVPTPAPGADPDPGPGLSRVALRPPAPNPFNAGVDIAFELPVSAAVVVEIVDTAGRVIRVVDRGVWGPGEGAVHWDGRDDDGHTVGSGVYWARLSTPSAVDTRKMVLVK